MIKQKDKSNLSNNTNIKLSSLVSDLLGLSARRMLAAVAAGETDPAALAALADRRLRATAEQLSDALGAATDLNPVYRRLIGMALEDLGLIEDQILELDQELARLLGPHHEQVQRLAEVPGLGVDSAQQVIAEVGPTAPTFPSAKQLASWVGACPGEEESADVNYSHRSPQGNRQMRRLRRYLLRYVAALHRRREGPRTPGGLGVRQVPHRAPPHGRGRSDPPRRDP